MRLYRLAELLLPGLFVGFIAGLVAGGLAGFVGQPIGWALVTGLALGIPLALLGAGYTMLLVQNKVRLGGFAPAALYWLIAYPAARLLHEVTTSAVIGGTPRLPEDVFGFLAYQGIVSAGFSIGFLWMHERVAPRYWQRISEHNPAAAKVYVRYAEHARIIFEAKERRKAMRGQVRAARRGGRPAGTPSPTADRPPARPGKNVAKPEGRKATSTTR
ncbi:hypothetical protein [Actinophytocola xinjiangensis]|nr:hypothetical protein [Actinophytocola xinjiangensis]